MISKDRHDSQFVTRVALRNYKSIAACDVRLGPLTFFVGPNGSGKSNFLDALRLVGESLRTTLDHALRDRGGIAEVRRRSSGHPTHFGIRLEFVLDGSTGHYAFDVGAKERGGYVVKNEECFVKLPGGTDAHYIAEAGRVARTTLQTPPKAAADRLYLVTVSGLDEFRPLFDALSHMGFYNLNPDRMRDLQSPDPGAVLARDGGNLAAVLTAMASQNPAAKGRVEDYLARVVSGVRGVDPKIIGPKETVEFRQAVGGATYPWKFLAASMSDGTLRALGILVALFQSARNGTNLVRLVGIEEPEAALHPAAAGVLTDGLREASQRTQVVVTSHSPDLLDNEEISDAEILAVLSERGETKIGRLDPPGRSALRDHLYTAGDLLRMDQLRPDPSETNLRPEQLNLFGPNPAD